jgi:4-hydroxythreonine-4-phosphate dehydrogenase
VSARTIAVAIGDPNGIGPEIAVKAAAAFAGGDPRIVLVGDQFVIERYGVPDNVHVVEALAREAFAPGRVDPAAGRATLAYAEAAFNLARGGHADAVVACPHSETAVNAAGIEFSGYPSLVARLANLPGDRVFLMLIGGRLRIVHATLHTALSDALRRLTPDLVEAAGRASVETLQRFGIARPRIGIFGINPHAGERGLFGDDDERITKPAAERLRGAGIDVEGPSGADELVTHDSDAFIAMYHDQGHIPVKLLAGRRVEGQTP